MFNSHTGTAVTPETWLAAEKLAAPRWIRGRSGGYTYYCVSTGLNTCDVTSVLAFAAASERKSDTTTTYAGIRTFGDTLVGEATPAAERPVRVLQWLDSVNLKKRVLFMHGTSSNVGETKRADTFGDAEMMAEMPGSNSIPTTVEVRTNRYRSYEVTAGALYSNIINESLADGIPVIMEQEFISGQVRSEVVTWLPKLDIYVRRDHESLKDDDNGQPRIGAGANGHFTSWDACTQAQATVASLSNSEVFVDASVWRYPRLGLYTGEYNREEHMGSGSTDGPTAPKNIKSVIIRPLTPSEDTLPSTRQEIIWKPPLGIFDVPHNIPTTTHELHMVIPNDYQTRCFDFGRQNLDATALGSGSGGRLMPFGLGANPATENKGQIYLRIEGFEFYAGMAMGPRADEAKFVLDLREYRMTPYSIPEQQTKQTHTYPFNLSPTTASVCVAFQSSKAGNGSVSLSKFIVPTQVAPRGAETALQRFFVTFANQNRPREENESVLSYRGYSADSMGTQTATDSQAVQYFTQRYMETMINAGQLYRPGGCESFEEWLERGAYYNWVWPRDGGDLSTRFHVNVAFNGQSENKDTDPVKEIAKQLLYRGWPRVINRGAPGAETPLINDINILVFDMIPKAFSLSVTNGKVVGSETTAASINDAARKMLRVSEGNPGS